MAGFNVHRVRKSRVKDFVWEQHFIDPFTKHAVGQIGFPLYEGIFLLHSLWQGDSDPRFATGHPPFGICLVTSICLVMSQGSFPCW